MASYNWWRRHPKRKTLDKSASLVDKIEHGDFEQSQYLEEAEAELDRLERIKEEIRLEGERKGWGRQTIEHDIKEKTNQYRRRYNRLMDDFFNDEDKILEKLKNELNSNFDDYWNYLYNEWLDGNLDDLSVMELYEEYKMMHQSGFEI